MTENRNDVYRAAKRVLWSSLIGLPVLMCGFAFFGCSDSKGDPAAPPIPLEWITDPVLDRDYVGRGNGIITKSLYAQGGSPPYTFQLVAGPIPDGFSETIDNDRGPVLSGVPTTVAVSSFTYQATDSAGGVAQRTFSWRITNSVVVTLADTNLTPGVVGASYTYSFPSPTEGVAPYSGWWVTSGSLPPGLTISSTTGVVSGTPTQTGTFSFKVRFGDAGGDNAVGWVVTPPTGWVEQPVLIQIN
jgi:hypothetical protein